MNLNLTLNQLSSLCHHYHNAMDALREGDPCPQYELFLEEHIGPSYEYVENIETTMDIEKFQYDPLFYLHLVQPQDEIESFIQEVKKDLKQSIHDVLTHLLSINDDLDHYSLYFLFLDYTNIPEDTLQEDDLIYQYFNSFSEKIF